MALQFVVLEQGPTEGIRVPLVPKASAVVPKSYLIREAGEYETSTEATDRCSLGECSSDPLRTLETRTAEKALGAAGVADF